jgi:hypothetical protein
MSPASEVVPRAIDELCRHRAERAAWKTRTAQKGDSPLLERVKTRTPSL